MFTVLQSTLAAAAFGALTNAPFWVQQTQDPFFPHYDVHIVDGEFDATTGGSLSLKSANKTFADTTLTVGPAWRQTGSQTFSNISATFAEKSTKDYTGLAVCTVYPGQQTTVQQLTWHDQAGGFAAGLIAGTAPPPPPPPPPTCGTSYNATTCKAVAGCEWCVSKDKAHALCFDATNPPPSAGWTCTK